MLVGHAIGQGDPDAARREAGAALACGVGFLGLTAILLTTMPNLLRQCVHRGRWRALAVASALIPIAGVFQVFDGVQACFERRAARSAGDTRVPAALNFAGYAIDFQWVDGAFSLGGGPRGDLVGARDLGLVVVAVALGWRVHERMGREPCASISTPARIAASGHRRFLVGDHRRSEPAPRGWCWILHASER
ncbi:MAG: MATE family efflux transporter [Gemmatimonadaceae bacterium]